MNYLQKHEYLTPKVTIKITGNADTTWRYSLNIWNSMKWYNTANHIVRKAPIAAKLSVNLDMDIRNGIYIREPQHSTRLLF